MHRWLQRNNMSFTWGFPQVFLYTSLKFMSLLQRRDYSPLPCSGQSKLLLLRGTTILWYKLLWYWGVNCMQAFSPDPCTFNLSLWIKGNQRQDITKMLCSLFVFLNSLKTYYFALWTTLCNCVMVSVKRLFILRHSDPGYISRARAGCQWQLLLL